MRPFSCFLLLLTMAPWTAGQSPAPASPKKFALLVGVNRYSERGFADRSLAFAERDAEELASELGKHGFQCTLLKGSSEGSNRATQENVFSSLDAMLDKAGASDIVLLAFAGHGNQVAMKDAAGNTLFDSSGKVQEDILFHPVDAVMRSDLTYPKSVSMAKVLDRLESEGGINLLLLDACRDIPKDSTRGARLVSGNDWKRNMAANTTILFACSGGQRAHEDKKAGGGHGIFFHTMLEGLRGAAAREKKVTWKSLEAYVIESTNANAERIIGKDHILPDQEELQTPHVIGNLNKNPVLVDLRAVHWLTPQEVVRRKAVAKQLFSELKEVAPNQRLSFYARLGDAKAFQTVLDQLIRDKGKIHLPSHEELVDPEELARNLGILVKMSANVDSRSLMSQIERLRDDVCRKPSDANTGGDIRRDFIENRRLQYLVDLAGSPEPYDVPSDFAAKIRAVIAKERSSNREPFNGVYPGIVFLIHADAAKCVAAIEADPSLKDEVRSFYKTLARDEREVKDDNSDAPTNRAILASLCGDEAELLTLPSGLLYTHYDSLVLPIIARRDWATLKSLLEKWQKPGSEKRYGAAVLNRAVDAILDQGEYSIAVEIWEEAAALRNTSYATHVFSRSGGIGVSTAEDSHCSSNHGRLGRESEILPAIRKIEDSFTRELAMTRLIDGLLTDVVRAGAR